MKLAGKVILITGASEGIGAACARAFSRRGARLALTARNVDKLRAVAGSEGFVVAGDLREPEARGRIVEAFIRRFGAIDVLVNNAGAGLYVPVAEASPEQVHQLFELNLFAALDLARLVVPGMRARGGGAIVNVSSIAGLVTLPWLTLYSASKHALIAATNGLRMELRPDRIQAISICPGYVDTGFQEHALAGEPPAALREKRPLAISAEQCAEAIARAVERNARTVVTPRAGWLLVAAARLFPALAERRLERMYRKGT